MKSEERRNDPVIRAKCAEIVEARRAMLRKAAKQLEAISDEMIELALDADDDIYTRCGSAVWSAYHRVSRDAQFLDKPATETYIGNMAAGELGEYIERKGL